MVYPSDPDSPTLEDPHGPEEVRDPSLQRERHSGLMIFLVIIIKLRFNDDGSGRAGESKLEEPVEVAGEVLEVVFEDPQTELVGGDLAADDGGVGDAVFGDEAGSVGGAGDLLDSEVEGAEAVPAVADGLGMADDAAEGGARALREREEAVVDGEDELADDTYAGVAKEEVEVAGDGTVDGVLGRDDGAVGDAVLQGGEGLLHLGAGDDQRWGLLPGGGRGEGFCGRLLAVGAPAALVGHADRGAFAVIGRVGGRGRGVAARGLAEEAFEIGDRDLEAQLGGHVLGGPQRRCSRWRRKPDTDDVVCPPPPCAGRVLRLDITFGRSSKKRDHIYVYIER